MVARNRPVAFVTEVFCDLCGKMVSDGYPDGVGGTNFWGMWARIVSQEPEKVSVELSPDLYGRTPRILRFSVASTFKTHAAYVICRGCGEKITTYLESWAQEARDTVKEEEQ